MSSCSLAQAAEEYLEMRRSLGYKLERQGRLLLDFVGYLRDSGAETITVDAAVSWANQPVGADPIWWQRRLSVVRCFARHLTTLDPACQVPPTDLLPVGRQRKTPYLYSRAEIAALVHAAGLLAVPLQAATYQALISLLAVSGMRVGEAVGSDRAEVDLDAALLSVVNGKHGKPRQVPLHPSTVAMLGAYSARRDHLCPTPATRAFFVSTTGTRLLVGGVDRVFTQLLAMAGIHALPGHRRPRVHDLRHSFAVATLLDWYRDGVDVHARLPVLSTFLGHVAPASTWWYLHAAPELLALAAHRLETSAGARP
ncbi:MAG: tyrosine-type recombinase/integrase [Pseudonocardiaceae bacterium]